MYERRHLTSVGDINDVDNFGNKSRVEHVTEVELRLEVGRTGKDDALNVNFVVGDEVLNRVLGNFSDVIVSSFHSQTRESEGRLSSSTYEVVQIVSGKAKKGKPWILHTEQGG